MTTRQLIKERITEAIGRWEPRVALQDVAVENSPADPRLVAITIQYRLIATQSVERLNLSLQLEG